MKKLLIFLSLIFIGFFSCKKTKEKVVLTHKEAVDTLAKVGVVDTTIKYTYLKNSNFLDTANLSKLFFFNDSLGQNLNVYNGFFGKTNHRIEFYFQKVFKDSLDPKTYHIIGKTRHKDIITPFNGSIILDSLFEFDDPQFNNEEFFSDASHKSFELKGKLKLSEDSTVKYSGVFNGDIIINFYNDKEQGYSLWYYSYLTGSKGGGFKCDGNWQSYHEPELKPFVFGADFFMFANSILKDFSFGEREVEINPKYVNLGWENFWENDEWYQ